MTAASILPQAIQTFVRRFSARKRFLKVLTSLGWAIACGITLAIAACAIDRIFHLPHFARLFLLIVDLLVMCALVLRPLGMRIGRGGSGQRGAKEIIAAAEGIERRTRVFDEKLVTVASQLLGPAQYRGSPQLLDQTLIQVAATANSLDPRRLLSWRPALLAWAAVAIAAAIAISFLAAPSVNMPRLLRRFVLPMADIPPVTEVQIHVDPGGADLIQGQSITIHVAVEHLAAPLVPEIRITGDGRTWSQTAMARDGDSADHFIFSLANVDHDLTYYVTAGDATSDAFRLRVQRVPAVSGFLIHYVYPAYTHRPPMNTSNVDGFIEAPTGTDADLELTTTEPLSSATLVMGKTIQHLSPSAASDGTKWEGRVRVTSDETYDTELVSIGGITSRSPGPMTIRALPDRLPLVRLIQLPDDLQMAPRDILQLRYEAIDDYGVAALAVRVSVNSAPAALWPLALRDGLVRAQGEVGLDLSPLALRIGDLVLVSILATDSAGQKTLSEMRRILIVPKGINAATRLELSALRRAASESAAAADGLKTARNIASAQAVTPAASSEPARVNSPLPASPQTKVHPDEAAAKARRAISSATEAAAALRLDLLRAIACTDTPEISLIMGNLAVEAEQQAGRLAQLASGTWPTDDSDLGQMGTLVENSREIAARIRTIYLSRLAAMVLTSQENFRSAQAAPTTARPAAEQRNRILQHLRSAMAASSADLGTDVNAPHAVELLGQLVLEGDAVAHDAARIDLMPGADAWVASLHLAAHEEPSHPPTSESSGDPGARRVIAEFMGRDFLGCIRTLADVESLGPRGDYVAAQDLDVAWRLGVIASKWPPSSELDEKTRSRRSTLMNEYLQYLPAILDESELARQADANPDSFAIQWPQQNGGAVIAARAKMTGLMHLKEFAGTSLSLAARQTDMLAFEANAATQMHEYTVAAGLDRSIERAVVGGSPDDMERYRRITEQDRAKLAELDRLTTLQEALVGESKTAFDRSSPIPAGGQAAVADALVKLLRRSVEVIDMTSATHPAGDPREAVLAALVNTSRQIRVWASHDSLWKSAPPDRTDQHEAANATTMPSTLDHALEVAQPESSAALLSLRTTLMPALDVLRQARADERVSGGPAKTAIAQQEAQRAADEVCRQLGHAQDLMILRFPLASAQALARLASNAISEMPRDEAFVAALQRKVIFALRVARAQTLREVSATRLALSPGFDEYFQARSFEGMDVVGSPFIGQWFRHQGKVADWSASTRDADTAAYQDAVRAYFDTLARPREVRP